KGIGDWGLGARKLNRHVPLSPEPRAPSPHPSSPLAPHLPLRPHSRLRLRQCPPRARPPRHRPHPLPSLFQPRRRIRPTRHRPLPPPPRVFSAPLEIRPLPRDRHLRPPRPLRRHLVHRPRLQPRANAANRPLNSPSNTL